MIEKRLGGETDAKGTRTQSRASPLAMIKLFKQSFKEAEKAYRFDIMQLNQTWVELLLLIKSICTDLSPRDYPKDQYGLDRHLNVTISHMFAGVLGVARYQPTRFERSLSTSRSLGS